MKSVILKMLSVSGFVITLLPGCGNDGSNNSKTLGLTQFKSAPSIPIGINCCITEELWGSADNFANTADQASIISPNFISYLPTVGVSPAVQVSYDQSVRDKHFVRSIKFGESKAKIDAMCHLSIRLHLKTIGGGAENDAIVIRANDAGTGNSTVSVTNAAVGTHSVGTIYDYQINLKPFSGILGGKSYIDVRVQDDTAVDYMAVRRGRYCGPYQQDHVVR